MVSTSELMDPSSAVQEGRRRSNTLGSYPNQYVPASRHSVDDCIVWASAMINSNRFGREEELYNYIDCTVCFDQSRDPRFFPILSHYFDFK